MKIREIILEKTLDPTQFLDRLSNLILADLRNNDATVDGIGKYIYNAFRRFKDKSNDRTTINPNRSETIKTFSESLNGYRSRPQWRIVKDGDSWMHVRPPTQVTNNPAHDYKLYLSFNTSELKIGNEFINAFTTILRGISASVDPLIKDKIHEAKICTEYSTLFSDVDNMIFYSDFKDSIKQLYSKVITQDVLKIAHFFDSTDRAAKASSQGHSIQRSQFGKDENGLSDSDLRATRAATAIIKFWPKFKHGDDATCKYYIQTQIASEFDSAVSQEDW